MTGLSRRQFLHVAATAAAATGIGLDALVADSARAATPAATAAGIPSTLLQTIRQGSVVSGRYRALTTGPGEPYIARTDVLRKTPSAARAASRRSLLYLGHLSDLHVIEAQSPGRIEPMIVQDHAAWGSAFHPRIPSARTRPRRWCRPSPTPGTARSPARR